MKQNQSHLLTKEENNVDVTNIILPRLAKKYINSISKITKANNEYIITFADGYTIFNQTTRKAKNIFGIMWYSRIATEEKEEGKFDFEKWKRNFEENHIVWDGKNIPEYILTEKQVKENEQKLKNAKVKAKTSSVMAFTNIEESADLECTQNPLQR